MYPKRENKNNILFFVKFLEKSKDLKLVTRSIIIGLRRNNGPINENQLFLDTSTKNIFEKFQMNIFLALKFYIS